MSAGTRSQNSAFLGNVDGYAPIDRRSGGGPNPIVAGILATTTDGTVLRMRSYQIMGVHEAFQQRPIRREGFTACGWQ